MKGAAGMSGFRVVIMDDSPFSRTLLGDALQRIGCEIVGEAQTLEELITVYGREKPDFVTMDLAMPGADGFECTKTLRLQDSSAKVIIISSMKDEETEAEAKKVGAAGYVQKPVDDELLQRIVHNVMAPDALYAQLEEASREIFAEALSQNLTRMTKTTATITEGADTRKTLSRGITVVIGIIGKYPGSLVVDLAPETAQKMAECMLHRPVEKQAEIVAVSAEFANVVGGVACSLLNRQEKSFGLRVAPPNVFHGAPNEITSPSIHLRTLEAATEFGPLSLSFGFKKGSVLWM